MNSRNHKGSSYEKMMKGFVNSTEKFLNKSLKIAKIRTKKTMAVVLRKVVTMVTPAKPPPREDVLFMTFIISVEREVPGWQKSILAILKKTKETSKFQMDPQGRIILCARADIKAFLKGVAKAANARLDWVQSGQCSSNLLLPQVPRQGYGHGQHHGYGDGDRMRPFRGDYGGYGGGHPPLRGGYGGGHPPLHGGYGGGHPPLHGGYGGGHQMGYGYNPMAHNHRPFARPFAGMNHPQAHSLMDDQNCPCRL